MVKLSSILNAVGKGFSHRTKFVDRIRVYVRGGCGGAGLPKYGGMGGDGGKVIFKAADKSNLFDLVTKYPKKRFLAGRGEDARRLMLMGASGQDLELEVPCGVTLTLDDGSELGELNNPGDTVTAANGGVGGGPHNKFTAGPEEARSLRVDLKLLADVGLVGFPNAGKSTFLQAVSRTQPKIANYPFTTLRPQLGTMAWDDLRRITVADLPGLIEGAHMNVGMGHYFLKHVERTHLLLVVVDINGFVLNETSAFRDAFETTILLNKELEMYKAELLDKPQVLLLNKLDEPGADVKLSEATEKIHNMKDYLHSIPEDLRPSRLFDFEAVIPISAQRGDNIDNVKTVLRNAIDRLAAPTDKQVQKQLQNHLQTHNEELSNVKLV